MHCEDANNIDEAFRKARRFFRDNFARKVEIKLKRDETYEVCWSREE